MQNCKLNPITQENVFKRQKGKNKITMICIGWYIIVYNYKK